jgi:hypothetical protein
MRANPARLNLSRRTSVKRIMTDDTNTSARLHRVWPVVAVACGLGLSLVWTTLLGYGIAALLYRLL